LIGRPEGRKPLRRPKLRWEDNIKVERGRWWEGVDWTHLSQDTDQWRALGNAVINFCVP
jgi:hypothetical protein